MATLPRVVNRPTVWGRHTRVGQVNRPTTLVQGEGRPQALVTLMLTP